MSQKSITKNSIYNILKTGSSILFPLITFPYVSRILLTENVGKVNFGLSIVSYFSLIASLGIPTYAIRECSSVRDNQEELSNVASQIWSINIITTAIAYFALTLTLVFFRKLDNYRLLIIIQSLTILATTLGADWLNSAMEDFKYISLRTVGFQFVSLLLMFIFVHHQNDYVKYAVISLVSSAGASIVNIWHRKRYCRVSFTRAINWEKHMSSIMYLFVMILAQTIFNSMDSTMLGLVHGDYEVGIYSTAHKIYNVINQVIGSLLWVILPRMSYFFAENKFDEVNRLVRKILGFNMLFGLPCAVGCYTMAEDVVRVVAGNAYLEAAPVLQILMIGFVFSLVGGNFLGNAILLPSKQEKYYMGVCCVTAIVNVTVNYIFIPIGRAKAAAGTTALCSLIMLVLLLFKVNKNIRIEKAWKLVLSPVVGSIEIVAVCSACRRIDSFLIRVTISIAVSVVLYCITQLLLKNELVNDVLKMLKRMIRRQTAEHNKPGSPSGNV